MERMDNDNIYLYHWTLWAAKCTHCGDDSMFWSCRADPPPLAICDECGEKAVDLTTGPYQQVNGTQEDIHRLCHSSPW